MATGASIAAIKAALITAYQSISLPGGLGTPTAIGRELDGNPPTVPYIEVFPNPSTSYSQTDEDSYITVRPFVVRLYVARLETDTPSLTLSDIELAENCAETITDYFIFEDDRLGRTAGVINSIIEADTAGFGGTPLFTRQNDNYAGLAIRHVVEYIRER